VELAPAGLTIVTVDTDTDIEAGRPFHEAAAPTHPSLVDPGHKLVELFGFTNIPFGLWIDESGTIVRPSDVAFGPRTADAATAVPAREETQAERTRRLAERAAEEAALTPEERAQRERQREARRKMFEDIGSGRYVEAVRDWVANGAESRYVLDPTEVIERSRPRPLEYGEASAEFELAQHLHRAGYGHDAVPHFKEAHRLDPENWSYVRQALAIADPAWASDYGYDMQSEMATRGFESFYPPLDL
jgi:hypothetical protein